VSGRIAVDSSAIVAVINREPEAPQLAGAMIDVEVVVGWPTILEIRLWLLRRPRQTTNWLDSLLTDPDTHIVSFGREHERFAAAAGAIYGRGRHPAALNYGDCMAYAVAKSADAPLLFKGSDFGQTDVSVHPASVLL